MRFVLFPTPIRCAIRQNAIANRLRHIVELLNVIGLTTRDFVSVCVKHTDAVYTEEVLRRLHLCFLAIDADVAGCRALHVKLGANAIREILLLYFREAFEVLVITGNADLREVGGIVTFATAECLFD